MITRRLSSETWYVLVVIFVSLILQKFIVFLPAILLGSIIISYTIDEPFAYLISLGIISEFFSFMSPGAMLVIMLLPWIIMRLLKVKVDISATFWGVLMSTILLQMVVWYVPFGINLQKLPLNIGEVWIALKTSIPLLHWSLVSLFVSFVSFGAIIGVYYNTKR